MQRLATGDMAQVLNDRLPDAAAPAVQQDLVNTGPGADDPGGGEADMLPPIPPGYPMSRDQSVVLLNKLFSRTRCNQGNPLPLLQFLNTPARTITDLLDRQPALAIEGIVNADQAGNLKCLITLLRTFLEEQPSRTRGYNATILRMTEWLEHHNQRQKMENIARVFTNTEGNAGAVDPLLSFTDFLTSCYKSAVAISNRLHRGKIWVAAYKEWTLVLSQINSRLPSVMLGQSPKSDVVQLGTKLVKSRTKFWDLFSEWSTMMVEEWFPEEDLDILPGLDMIRLLLPDIAEDNDANITDMANWIDRTELDRLLVRYDTDHDLLNPEEIAIMGPKWILSNKVLIEISKLKEGPADIRSGGAQILMEDITATLREVTINGSGFTRGKREVTLSQLESLLKRLDRQREAGLPAPEGTRESLLESQARLVEDGKVHDAKVRLEEAIAKREHDEAAKSAPRSSLQPLHSINDWVGYLSQLRRITSKLTSEESKCQLVTNSLRDKEDIEALKGVVSHEEQLLYLRTRYHKVQELSQAILLRGTSMPFPDKSISQSKKNIICIQGVWRDLKTIALDYKMDVSYVKMVASKTFTCDEYDVFLRKRMEHDDERNRRARFKAKLQKTIRHASSQVGGDAIDEIDLANAAAGRGLSDDESESDDDDFADDVSVITFASAGNNKATKDDVRERKFFFNYCQRILSHYRSKEATHFALTGKKSNDGGGRSRNGGSSSSHFTEGVPEDYKCPIEGCGKQHYGGRKGNKKLSAALGYCSMFKKMELQKRNAVLKANKCCLLCLTPGHKAAQCHRKEAKCNNCSKMHHELICTVPKKKDDKKQKPPNSSSHKTDTGDTDAGDKDTEETTQEPPTTENNMTNTDPRSFQLTESESFLLSRGGKNFTHSCIGEVSIQSQRDGDMVETMALFDSCSTDSWCSEEFAMKHQLQKIKPWSGLLRTINGEKEVTLNAVRVKILNHDTKQMVQIECLVTKSISWKPAIETPRFNRLCSAFNVCSSQVDCNGGTAHLLIGLKCERLGLKPIAKFKSDVFPHVGLYSSPLLRKFIFVGVSDVVSGPTVVMNNNTSSFRTETLDKKLEQWLQSESEIALSDVLCERCHIGSKDCSSCKAANSEITLVEMEEDENIRKAIEVKPNEEQTGFRFWVEYPTISREGFASLYRPENSNQKMALESSKRLRVKLKREGKLLQFHNQVWEAVSKKYALPMSPELNSKYEGLPASYQLINFVIKDTSATTKLRVVSNSSINRCGGSFNSNLQKGSSKLNNALQLVNRFSVFPYTLMTDISQAYRAVQTKDVTNSCRRFFWFSDPNDEKSIVELVNITMNFGDRPAGSILGHCRELISEDPSVDELLRSFIIQCFYVDDGIESSADRSVILKLKENLPRIFLKYGFQLKHILCNFEVRNEEKAALKQGDQCVPKVENFFGLLHDVGVDQLRPNLEVHLCKKKRGQHTDPVLSASSIVSCVPTRRIVLRVVGQIYDLTGRILGPLQATARQVYREVCLHTSGWDDKLQHPDTLNQVKQLLTDVIEVKENLLPMRRAWVPIGYNLNMLICPIDGGISGYGAAVYAQSRSPAPAELKTGPGSDNIMNPTQELADQYGPEKLSLLDMPSNYQPKEFDCTVVASRAKTSIHDVGRNELSASLLGVKLVKCTYESIPTREVPPGLQCVLVSDSQCTCYAHAVTKVHDDRARKNLSVRFHRQLRELHAQTGGDILLTWRPGIENPADYVSKRHVGLAGILNSSFWRLGHTSYASPTFLENSHIYAAFRDGSFIWYGFTAAATAAHMAECMLCEKTLKDRVNVNTSHLYSTQSEKPLLQKNGTLERDWWEKAADINSLVNIVATGVRLADRSRGIITPRNIATLRAWLRIIENSQQTFHPNNVRQQLPVKISKFGCQILITKNRLTPYAIASFHKTPLSGIPIISNADTALIDKLFACAHVSKSKTTPGEIHFTKNQTLFRLKSSRFGVHIPSIAKIVSDKIKKCVHCIRMDAELSHIQIGTKFPFNDGTLPTIFARVGMDILGPYSWIAGRRTKGNPIRKSWCLMITCQVTSAVNFVIMEDYSAKAMLAALHQHCNEYIVPDTITCDCGSQLKSAARLTRARTKQNEDLSADTENLEEMLIKTKSQYSSVLWHIAAPSAQFVNGAVEGNYRVAKKYFQGFLRRAEGVPAPTFPSMIELTRLFSVIKHSLNSRPILPPSSSMPYITAKDLLLPSPSKWILSDDHTGDIAPLPGDEEDKITFLSEFGRKLYEEFEMELTQQIVSGDFKRAGGKAHTNKATFLPGDFVLVFLPTQKVLRYGLVNQQLSPHKISVKICTRKTLSKNNKNKSYCTKDETFAAQQIRLLYRKLKSK